MKNKSIFSGNYPQTRMRRNRMKNFSNKLISENNLNIHDLIYPIFITEGKNISDSISSMPGVFRFSIDRLLQLLEDVVNLGIPAIALFPCIEKQYKDSDGSEAINSNNLVCRAVKLIKKEFPDLGLICDVALDPYTNHGHDGILINDVLDNDKTVDILCKQALVQAEAGCDIIAPSDMMDGRVAAIRNYLDENNFIDTQIMSYAAKYASSSYGPFRDAVGSNNNKKTIDKSSYQMNPANSNEAIREVELDISEGADMVIIKPGMPYLDIIYRVKSECNIPVFAYQVSGEYAMITYAAKNQCINKQDAMLESIIAFKRAGADGVLSYFALEVAKIISINK